MLDTGVSGCRVSFNDQKERLPSAEDNSHEGRSDFKRKSRARNKDMLNEGRRPENRWAPTPGPVVWQVPLVLFFKHLQVLCSAAL